ncbi:MAG: hypothetical protein HWQ38_17330 [Nostoc sp. NMS7]|uniref:hypothetical protein n=1 Tax=Nostoc sp. NMS7 TaxID=2815391 RepID=UPI00306E96E2|nr:hypothetical protein [Nostoc sp. NMS7]
MLVLDYKAVVSKNQTAAIEEAIRTTQFIRNKAIRFWMDAPRESKINKIGTNNRRKGIRLE